MRTIHDASTPDPILLNGIPNMQYDILAIIQYSLANNLIIMTV